MEMRGLQVLRPLCTAPQPALSQEERMLKVLIYSIRTAYFALAFLWIVTWVLSPA
jgi:hypothetical protein